MGSPSVRIQALCWPGLSSDRMSPGCILASPGSWLVLRCKDPYRSQALPTPDLFHFQIILLKMQISLLLTSSLLVSPIFSSLPFAFISTIRLSLHGIFYHLSWSSLIPFHSTKKAQSHKLEVSVGLLDMLESPKKYSLMPVKEWTC